MDIIRRIQKTGGSTYIVSLPKDWISDSGLGKGDEVIMEYDKDGSLRVGIARTHKGSKLSKDLEIDNEIDQKLLMRKLIGIYVSGYDVINVRSKSRISADNRKTIQEFARRVIGPEIIEEGTGTIILQDVADHADLSMKKVLRRMHLMVRNMLDESIRSIEEGSTTLATQVIERDDDVDRLYWFVEKQHAMLGRNPSFASRMRMSSIEANSYLSASKALERIADHAARIAWSLTLTQFGKIDEMLIEKLVFLGEKSISILDESIDALVRGSSEIANRCIERTAQLRDETNDFIGEAVKKRGKVAVSLSFAAESIERIGGYSADISEIAINLAEGG
ncbi:MAG TPA: phosphate uptake regulator PhoU [Euryarchaeota archaeon]|nr:phosphate uptake regulator PhoU [Euryarchaeota archaeon]